MDYQNYAERIKLLYNFQSFKPPRLDEKEAVRIGTKNSEMTTYKIRKTKFSQLSDKRFYFPNAVLSLSANWTWCIKRARRVQKEKGPTFRELFYEKKK